MVGGNKCRPTGKESWKDAMRTQSQQTISEVQKIWYRVMSILYRSGGQSVRIPSSNELAQEFGIARSTVRIALEKLTAEGFLITRRGSGTFTNPKCRLNANWDAPLVGLLMLDGNLFFYSQELQNELECFFAEFRETGWNIRLVTGQMDTPEAVQEILSHNYLDGLITFGSSEFIPQVADAMLPTVNMGFFTEHVTNVIPAFNRVLNKLFERTGRDREIRVWTATPRNIRSEFLRACHAHPGLTVIHASNDEVLWVRVRRTIEVFLTGMWRAGSLAGSSPEEAFFVNIGRDTMTEQDILNGRLICVIGAAPSRPAEFVIFRITQNMKE